MKTLMQTLTAVLLVAGLANIVDFGMDAQHAGEAPRFRHSGQGLALESAIDGNVRFGCPAKAIASSTRSARSAVIRVS